MALAGLALAEQARFSEKRELRSVRRLDQLEAQVQALTAASTLQAGQVDRMAERVDHIRDNVVDLPALVETTVQRSTSSLVTAMSSLALKPSFQNLYVPASGFRSDDETGPANLQPVLTARPSGDFGPRRHRQPNLRRRVGRHDGVTPVDAANGAGLGQDTEASVPASEP